MDDSGPMLKEKAIVYWRQGEQGPETVLLEYGAFCPSFSPDGKSMLYTRRGDEDYYWKRYKGGQAIAVREKEVLAVEAIEGEQPVAALEAALSERTAGVPTGLPWGIDFGDGIPRHPLMLYEMLFLGLLWPALAAARRRSGGAGRTVPAAIRRGIAAIRRNATFPA